MKTINVCLAILLTFPLLAQNWNPLVSGSRYNYQHADSAHITNVILVDSQQQSPTGQVVFLNRIMLRCDTCAQPAMLRNQAQFLQKTAQALPNGDWWLAGDDSLLLKPHCQAGDSWIFNPQNGTEAVCGQAGLELVFGEWDSVKTIQLSYPANGATSQFLFSKQHGILKFERPDKPNVNYVLSGIEDPNQGEQLPDMYDFFDWHEGDVFQWNYLETGAWGEGVIIKTTILGRQQVGDTLVFQVKQGRDFRGISQDLKQFVYKVYPSLDAALPAGYFHTLPSEQPHWLADYPGELTLSNKSFVNPDLGFDTTVVNFFTHPVFGPTKRVGQYPMPFESTPDCSGFYAQDASDVMPCSNECVFWELYSVGLGRTHLYSYCPNEEFGYEGILEAFVKNGDTTGVLRHDWTFTSAKNPSPQLFTVELFPNPVKDKCTVYFSIPLVKPGLLQVMDAQGITLQRHLAPQQAERFELETTGWQNGIFLLLFSDGSHQATLRMAVFR